MIPKRLLLIGGAIVVAAIVLFAFVVPVLTAKPFLSTSIVAIDPYGVSHTLYAPNQGAIVTANGVQIASVQITTSFTATSPNYNAYTVIPGAVPVTWGQTSARISSSGTSWAVVLFYAQSVSVILACGYLSFAQAVPASQTFSIGTTYYVGNSAALIGTTANPTATIPSSTILGWTNANGCPATGSFTLSYGVQVTVQAAGTAPVPSATYSAIYSVGLSVGTGTISITGSTTGTTQ